MAKPIVIVSCLDTKGREVEYCKQIIEAAGVPTMVIDAGVFAPPLIEPDIPREEVCSAIGACWQAVQQGDKTHRIETIIAGITAIVCELQAKQQIGGLFSIGGGANTIIGTRIMQALPVGIPKLMVSTTSSGRRMFDPYVGTKDIMLMHSVADISGLNAITRTVLKNAAAAMVGMATLGAGQLELPKNTIATTMLGVTTDGVEGAAAELESHGFDVVRFHATGVGGRALEELAKSRVFAGILDLTLHEITCEWFGMGYSYGAPNRLLAAAEAGIPLVCAPGAVDVMDFDLAELPEGRGKHIYQTHRAPPQTEGRGDGGNRQGHGRAANASRGWVPAPCCFISSSIRAVPGIPRSKGLMRAAQRKPEIDGWMWMPTLTEPRFSRRCQRAAGCLTHPFGGMTMNVVAKLKKIDRSRPESHQRGIQRAMG